MKPFGSIITIIAIGMMVLPLAAQSGSEQPKDGPKPGHDNSSGKTGTQTSKDADVASDAIKNQNKDAAKDPAKPAETEKPGHDNSSGRTGTQTSNDGKAADVSKDKDKDMKKDTKDGAKADKKD